MKESKKYHYFYKITNLLNNHFYYGVHNTNNIEDGYMGSGKRLHYAYKKYGIENFEKEILKYFDTAADAFKYEADYITEELVKDPNCYNIQKGGEGFNTSNLVTVKDKEGKCFLVHHEDPRYLNGELVSVNKNMRTVYDTIQKKYIQISVNEILDKNRYKFWGSGVVACKKIGDKKYMQIPLNEYDPSIYETPTTNKILVKDKNGNFYSVFKDEPRYLNGELVPIWKGRHHKEETKQKWHETYLKTQHQQGEKNSQYGTCWIHNNSESIKIKKEQLDEYISNGWIKGRKMKF